MESEFLKEPWAPEPRATSAREEDNAIVSAWEENFQDLSGWCMDAFQGQCDFHIGESSNFKLSGTKYEGNGVLSTEEGVSEGFSSVTEDEARWNIKMSTGMPIRPIEDDRNRSTEPILETIGRYVREDAITDTQIPNTWMRSSKVSVDAPGSLWKRQRDVDHDPDPDASSLHASNDYRVVDEVEMDEACSTSFESKDNQRETWDVLRTVETTGSDTFDLLSYLCDDEMRSPEGSMSTDSSTISRPRATTITSKHGTETSVRVKVEEDEPSQPKTRNRTTCTATSTTTSASSSTASSSIPSRRIERTRSSAGIPIVASHSKVEKGYTRTRREKKGRKWYAESDSDDRSSVSHYRESREKNNEASRKSRMNKKAKETEMSLRAIELERDNRILKMKVEELEKLVTSMRSALLRSALKKEF